MKAIRYYAPSGPEGLKVVEEPPPGPLKPEQLLVEVHAVSVIGPELYWPIYQDANGDYINVIPARDFSGVVTEVGSEVTNKDLQPGAEVIAFTSDRQFEGAMAEFSLAAQKDVVPKPRNLDFVEAASIPLSALTSWQAFYDHANLKAGQRVLITGAAGPTAMFGVQIAKRIGAEVIGTASSPASFEMLQSFGIDKIIDYKKTNIEDEVHDVDVVYDCVGGAAFKQSLKTLKKDGIAISIVEFNASEEGTSAGRNAKFFIVSMNAEQLAKIKALVEEGSIRTVVDSTYSFNNVREAFEKALSGSAHGKIVLKVK